MNIKLANVYGFCEGVEKAVEKGEREAAKSGTVHTLGELIHNPMEVERLHSIGVTAVADAADVAEGNTVLVRAHGIPRDQMKELRSQYRVVDATCPLVTKVQRAAQKEARAGRTVLVYGNPNHPEIKGVVSYTEKYRVVYSDEELAQACIDLKDEPVALLSQTTANVASFKKAGDYLTAHHPDAVVRDTICYATYERQEAIDELAREVDAVLVIGGPNSSNTKQLAAVARQHCQRVYLLEKPDDIQPAWVTGVNTLGVTAGASTPQWIIDAIIARAQALADAA